MSVAVSCPGCGQRLAVRDNGAGEVFRCPKCQQRFKAPDETGQAPVVIGLAAQETSDEDRYKLRVCIGIAVGSVVVAGMICVLAFVGKAAKEQPKAIETIKYVDRPADDVSAKIEVIKSAMRPRMTAQEVRNLVGINPDKIDSYLDGEYIAEFKWTVLGSCTAVRYYPFEVSGVAPVYRLNILCEGVKASDLTVVKWYFRAP